MDDKEYYEKIKKINSNNLYKKINKNKSKKWKDFKDSENLNLGESKKIEGKSINFEDSKNDK
ncbi:MAG: hypothetical protein P8K05_03460 [Dehalococcoidia bacterium]|jgi:hypothetical protein|nr:hypothetical protein [Dehalococcoidia bacterium]